MVALHLLALITVAVSSNVYDTDTFPIPVHFTELECATMGENMGCSWNTRHAHSFIGHSEIDGFKGIHNEDRCAVWMNDTCSIKPFLNPTHICNDFADELVQPHHNVYYDGLSCSCFLFVDNVQKSYSGAESTCKQGGSRLAWLRDSAQFHRITSSMPHLVQKVTGTINEAGVPFIGGVQFGTDQWYWRDKNEEAYCSFTKEHHDMWARKQPNHPHDMPEYCLVLLPNPGTREWNYGIHNWHCFTEHTFLCEKVLSEANEPKKVVTDIEAFSLKCSVCLAIAKIGKGTMHLGKKVLRRKVAMYCKNLLLLEKACEHTANLILNQVWKLLEKGMKPRAICRNLKLCTRNIEGTVNDEPMHEECEVNTSLISYKIHKTHP